MLTFHSYPKSSDKHRQLPTHTPHPPPQSPTPAIRRHWAIQSLPCSSWRLNEHTRDDTVCRQQPKPAIKSRLSRQCSRRAKCMCQMTHVKVTEGVKFMFTFSSQPEDTGCARRGRTSERKKTDRSSQCHWSHPPLQNFPQPHRASMVWKRLLL